MCRNGTCCMRPSRCSITEPAFCCWNSVPPLSRGGTPDELSTRIATSALVDCCDAVLQLRCLVHRSHEHLHSWSRNDEVLPLDSCPVWHGSVGVLHRLFINPDTRRVAGRSVRRFQGDSFRYILVVSICLFHPICCHPRCDVPSSGFHGVR